MFTVRFLNYAGDDLLGVVEAEYGEDITSKAPTPEIITGKSFNGWNVPITHIEEDMTVRPTYVDITYTVVFKKYDGGNLSVQHIAHGHAAVAPTPELIPGNTFTGWDKGFSNVTSDLTVNPLYTAQILTVRFYSKGGETLWSTQQVEYGKDAVPPSPEKCTGFTFIGWSASFRYITHDTDILAVYREIPPNPRLSIYEQNADGSSGSHVKTYSAVNGCGIVQKLDGECSLDAKIITKQTEGYISTGRLAEVEGLIFTVTEVKKNISSGICYTEFSGDHVSYGTTDLIVHTQFII